MTHIINDANKFIERKLWEATKHLRQRVLSKKIHTHASFSDILRGKRVIRLNFPQLIGDQQINLKFAIFTEAETRLLTCSIRNSSSWIFMIHFIAFCFRFFRGSNLLGSLRFVMFWTLSSFLLYAVDLLIFLWYKKGNIFCEGKGYVFHVTHTTNFKNLWICYHF